MVFDGQLPQPYTGRIENGIGQRRGQAGYTHLAHSGGRVAVRQEFRNDGSEWVEGIYVFPLPDDAAVDRMKLYIGERFIEGEIREKEQARKDYEQAKREGRKASLVNQQRANLFTTAVANIAPGETVTIEIE